MAKNGHLTKRELEKIGARAKDAKERIDAGDERISSGSIHCDQAAVELARKVKDGSEGGGVEVVCGPRNARS